MKKSHSQKAKKGIPMVALPKVSILPTTLSVDEIEIPVNEMRQVANLENLEELTQSIRECGIINPIMVRKSESGKYEIVAGVRRFMAAQAAHLAHVPVVISKLDDIGSDKIKIHENIYREDINPTDEAIFYSKLIEKYSLSKKQIADLVKKSESYISTRIDLLGAPNEIAAAVQGEQINLSVALELAKISDEQTRKYYLGIAIENGITINTARTWRINWEIESGIKPIPVEPTADQKNEIQRAIFTDTCAACRNIVQLHERRILILCPSCHQIITNPPQR